MSSMLRKLIIQSVVTPVIQHLLGDHRFSWEERIIRIDYPVESTTLKDRVWIIIYGILNRIPIK